MTLAVEYLNIDALIPYARNARTHSEDQIDQLCASITEFGFTNPVLIDADGVIIAGHGRVMAGQQLGMSDVPCIRLSHLSDAQRRAYVLADNQLALNAGWDPDILALELRDLQTLEYDLSLTGFDLGEIDELFAQADATPEGQKDEDAVPKEAAVVVSKQGDLWLCGGHRLLCGDSGDAPAVSALMDGERAAIMQTDPPYGVSHVATKDGIPRSGFSDMADRWEDIKNDDLQDEALQRFLTAIFTAAKDIALRDNAAWYLWHAYLTQGFFAAAAAAADVLLHRQIIWKKPSMVLTRSGMYHWKHEPCFYGWRRGNKPPWYGNKSQTSVWEIGRDTNTVHPTQKPVALWYPGMENHTKPGQICYEPFSGSGSQMIAAEQLGRRCFGVELSPQYVDVAVRRWQEFTGKKATLQASGEPFKDAA